MTATRRLDAAGLAGVTSVVLTVIGQIARPIWTFPSTTASGDAIRAFVHHHRAALQFEMVLNAGAVALWIVFGCGVWLRIRPAGNERSILGSCVIAGVTSFVSLLLVGFVAFDVLVYHVPDASQARLLYDLVFGMLAMSGLPTAIALIGYAVAVYTRRTMPRRTAHLAVAAGAAHVLLLLSFVVPTGFFSLQGGVITAIPALLFAWIAYTGAAMIKFSPPADERAPSPHPASVPSDVR